MKKLMYTRLTNAQWGYGYYIPPVFPVGPLHKVIVSDTLDSAQRLLLLQKNEGVITFGIRENLPKRDQMGRPICTFIGYSFQENDGFENFPNFDSFSRSFDKIMEDALRCHELLDQKLVDGKSLQEAEIIFDGGRFNPNVDWDNAIQKLQKNGNFTFVFDASGKFLFEKKNEYAVSRSEETIISKPVPQNTTGIFSTVTLDESEKTIIPVFEESVRPKNKPHPKKSVGSENENLSDKNIIQKFWGNLTSLIQSL